MVNKLNLLELSRHAATQDTTTMMDDDNFGKCGVEPEKHETLTDTAVVRINKADMDAVLPLSGERDEDATDKLWYLLCGRWQAAASWAVALLVFTACNAIFVLVFKRNSHSGTKLGLFMYIEMFGMLVFVFVLLAAVTKILHEQNKNRAAGYKRTPLNAEVYFLECCALIDS